MLSHSKKKLNSSTTKIVKILERTLGTFNVSYFSLDHPPKHPTMSTKVSTKLPRVWFTLEFVEISLRILQPVRWAARALVCTKSISSLGAADQRNSFPASRAALRRVAGICTIYYLPSAAFYCFVYNLQPDLIREPGLTSMSWCAVGRGSKIQ